MSIVTSCHCKAFTHQLDLSAEIPAEDTFCLCTSCRQRTGQLGIFPFPGKLTDSQHVAQSSLKRYNTVHPETGNTVSTFFCPTCGSKVFIQVIKKDTGDFVGGGWMIGCFDRFLVDHKPILKIHGYSFVEDTVDGGFAAFWKQAQGQELKLYDGNFEPWTAPPVEPRREIANKGESLHLHCRCGGFSVFVARPEAGMKMSESYWTSKQCAKEQGYTLNRFAAEWYVLLHSTVSRTRLTLRRCGCTSCRVASGSCLPAFPWIRVPLSLMYTSPKLEAISRFFPEDMTTQTDLPGLTRYHASSQDVARYHCSTCGASVLFYGAKSQGAYVDVAAGLIDHPSGVLALDWLDWWTGKENDETPSIEFVEEARERWGDELVGDFQRGLASWGNEIGQR